MLSGIKLFTIAVAIALLTSCATVPMADPETSARLKTFPLPAPNQAGLYIYRDSFAGQALKLPIILDDNIIGETANRVYFYQLIDAGRHTIGTTAGFGNNEIRLTAVAGKNYFVRLSIGLEVYSGGATLTLVPDPVGQAQLQTCQLAISK